MNNFKIAVIGTGMMGSAIINGIIKKGLIPSENILTSDVDTEKMKALHETLGTTMMASNKEAVEGADVVLIAVKPQYMGKASAGILGNISQNALLISIAAGISIQQLRSFFGCENIIRFLPNTPAQIGKGITGWCTTASVTPQQKAIAQEILKAMGESIEFDDESWLDSVGAVSGSGPAYVYLFIEAMIDAAVQMGIPRPMAQKLTLQTVIGSAEYMAETGKHPAILRNEVTSPGGTTAAAIAAFEKDGFRTSINNAMFACLERTKALGKKE